ncbi:MAG: molybdate ABC transporter substrate-binding protein [Pseudomonadota bacterium]
MFNSARSLVGAATMILAAIPASAETVTVFAAASLKNALDAVAADWQTATGDMIVISYGGSSSLAKQIQQGAPADIFVSAATNWMDTLEADGKIQTGTRRDLFGNTLVLVANRADASPVSIDSGLDMAGLLDGGKLSMAMVDSVPAGQYGKAALENLGLWASVESSVVQSENVRAALSLVALGEAPLGIVYGSDAIADASGGSSVTVIGTFPPTSYPAIVYPAALISGSTATAAPAFLDYLSSDQADAIFSAQGFLVPQ